MPDHHHRKTLDDGYHAIQTDLLRMVSLLDQSILEAMQSLANRDRALAQKVVDGDNALDHLRYVLEEACLALIATQQPAAGDLRAIMAFDFIAVELERMADYTAGIAKMVIRMGDEPLAKPLNKIPRMAELCRRQLKDSIDALLARDATAARAISAKDDEIDNLYRSVFHDLIEVMAKDPSSVTRGTYLLWCAHNLERIGDRITNIAERVIFIRTGNLPDNQA